MKVFPVRNLPKFVRSPHPPNFVLGVDVGVRNLGMALLFDGPEPQPLALSLYDLGSEAMDDRWTLCARLHEAFHEFLRVVPAVPDREVRVELAIETQEKQTGDAFMVMVAGMCHQAFHHEIARREHFRGSIAGQSPSCPTCLRVQRAVLLPERVKAVTRREEKKEKAVEMLERWLESSPATAGARTSLNLTLCRFREDGRPIKKYDRRDHVADAAMHAYYCCLQHA